MSSQGKLQKHQAFEAEVQANAAAIIELDKTGNLMITEGHFASETIRVRHTDSQNRPDPGQPVLDANGQLQMIPV